MKNILLKVVLLLLISIMIFSQTACEPHGYIGREKQLNRMAEFSFPTTDYFEYIDRIASDDFGRILFQFKTSTELFYDTDDGFIYAYMVAQQIEKKSVSFYEFICCFLSKFEITDPNSPELSDFLKKNDWGKTLCPEKMITVPNAAPDRTLWFSDAKEIVEDIGIKGDFAVGIIPTADGNGNIILVRTYTYSSDGIYEYAKSYAIFKSNDDASTEYIEINDFYNYPEEISVWLSENQKP